MDAHLPPELLTALKSSREPERRSTHFSVTTADRDYEVHNLRSTGFDIAADGDPHLRGFVDLMHGPIRLARCLIICAQEDDGVVSYEFKQRTADLGAPPVDYARAPDGPVALLGG